MKYNGIIKGSTTMDAAAIIGILGAVQQYLPMIQEGLAGYYGYVTIGIAAIMAYYRWKTNKPIAGK